MPHRFCRKKLKKGKLNNSGGVGGESLVRAYIEGKQITGKENKGEGAVLLEREPNEASFKLHSKFVRINGWVLEGARRKKEEKNHGRLRGRQRKTDS